MATIQIGIEGEDAVEAAETLLQIPEVSGSYEAPQQKEGTITVIATIVGIVGGTVALAEQIRKWYQEWKQSHSGKRFDVVISSDNGIFVLEEATIEEICQVLKVLEK